MLELLQKRYKYLCDAKFDKAEKVEKQLTKLKDDPNHYAALTTPNTFFCTFTEGEGRRKATSMGEIDCDDGHKLKIKQAKNPSNILWMNMGVPRKTQIIRGLIVAFIILIIVVIVYCMFTVEVSAEIYISYKGSPPGINCESMIEAETVERAEVLAGLEYAYL